MTETTPPRIKVNAPVPAPAPAPNAPRPEKPLIETEKLSLSYGPARALKDISFQISEKLVTAFIGPSGCGKSTLLPCLNRTNASLDNLPTPALHRPARH